MKRYWIALGIAPCLTHIALTLAALTLAALTLAALLVTPTARAQDEKPIFSKEDKLTDQDPKDKLLRNSHAKIYTVKLDAGKSYRIDMTSTEIDSFLRVEDSDGTRLGMDDDGAGYPNARLILKAAKDDGYKIIATTFGAPMGGLKATGAFTLTIVPASPLDILELRANNIAKSSIAERNATINELKAHLKENQDKIGNRELQMVVAAGQGLEMKSLKQATVAYTDFGKIIAKSDNPQIAGFGRMLEGSARRLNLMGNTMEVKGRTLDGKELDLAKLKGKVVLVDFWATWCGPCLQEIPGMKKMVEAYKDRGFEILAVSIDQDKERLERFLENRKLPWQSIHDTPQDGKLLAEYYGVMSIPLPILVDREGKVVSMEARGAELERLLEKHIGPLEK